MLGAATHECPADSPSVVVTFANSTTSDGSTTPTTEDATTTAELPVDIQQLLDESERQALELLRTSSEAIRTRLLRREQPQATSPAALKSILDEQTQWLKVRRARPRQPADTAYAARACLCSPRLRHARGLPLPLSLTLTLTLKARRMLVLLVRVGARTP